MRMIGLSCIFPVPKIKETAEFYTSKLNFRAVEYLNCKEPHICLYKDDVEIILLQANVGEVLPNRKLYGYGYDAYLYTKDLAQLEKEFMIREIKIIKRLNMTDYQNNEIVIEDCDGRWVAFGIKIKS